MQISSVSSSTAFTGGKFITPEMHSNIEYLLTRMNAETKENSNIYRHCSSFVKSLKYQDKAKFTDGRMIFSKVEPDKQMVKESFLSFNNTELVINNKNGEIIDYHKPALSSWKKVLKTAEKYLNALKNNYDDATLVTKERLKYKELTPEGKKVSKMLEFYI